MSISSRQNAIANVRNLIVNGGRFTNNSTLYDGYVIKGAVFEARDLLQVLSYGQLHFQ